MLVGHQIEKSLTTAARTTPDPSRDMLDPWTWIERQSRAVESDGADDDPDSSPSSYGSASDDPGGVAVDPPTGPGSMTGSVWNGSDSPLLARAPVPALLKALD